MTALTYHFHLVPRDIRELTIFEFDDYAADIDAMKSGG